MSKHKPYPPPESSSDPVDNHAIVQLDDFQRQNGKYLTPLLERFLVLKNYDWVHEIENAQKQGYDHPDEVTKYDFQYALLLIRDLALEVLDLKLQFNINKTKSHAEA